MSFASQFAAGASIAKGLLDTYRDSKVKGEMDEVANAKAVQSQGYTPEDDQQMDAMSKALKPDGTPYYNVRADGSGNRQVQSNFDYTGQDGETVVAGALTGLGAKPVTDFLGKRTAGHMTDDQVTSARMQAMASTIGKYNPIEGMRMAAEAKRGERDDQRFAWEKSRGDREERTAKKTEDYETGLQSVYNDSIYAKNMADYAPQAQSYQAAQTKYDADMRQGVPGQQAGIPPQAPQRPVYTLVQSLADQGRFLAYKVQHGKADPSELGKYAEAYKKVADEGYVKALRLAQGGASVAQVAEVFGQSGEARFDPASVVADRMVSGAGGVPSRVIDFKGPNGQVQSINVMAELDALGQAESHFNRFYKAEDNRRGNNADSRAGVQLGETMRHNRASEGIAAQGARDRGFERSESIKAAEASVNLYQENNPNATPAQLEAVRRKVIKAVPEMDSNAPSAVKLANAALKAKVPGVTDMASGLQWARGKTETTPGEIHKGFVAAALKASSDGARAVKDADATMAAMGYAKTDGRWTEKKPAGQAGAPTKGTIDNGFEFLGGNPKDKSNWRPVSSGAVK